jgi:hypothetical protein
VCFVNGCIPTFCLRLLGLFGWLVGWLLVCFGDRVDDTHSRYNNLDLFLFSLFSNSLISSQRRNRQEVRGGATAVRPAF